MGPCVIVVVQEAFQELADVNGATGVAITFGQEAPHLQLSATGSIGSRYSHTAILEFFLAVRRYNAEGPLIQNQVTLLRIFFFVTLWFACRPSVQPLDSARPRTCVAVYGNAQCECGSPLLSLLSLRWPAQNPSISLHSALLFKWCAVLVFRYIRRRFWVCPIHSAQVAKTHAKRIIDPGKCGMWLRLGM